MRKATVLAIVVAAAAFTAGCSHLGPVYYKASQEYSFHPPAGWRYNAPDEELAIFQSHSIRGSKFRPVMTVVVENTKLDVVEDYMEKQLAELQKLPGFQKGEEDIVGMFEGRRFEYSYLDPRNKTPITAIFQVIIRGTRVYAITCLSPASHWKKFKGLFYDSLDTFKFGEEAVPLGEKGSAYAEPELPAPK
jgi:hypothetical protein